MIRHGNHLRLTAAERQCYQADTGCSQIPTTVEDYNRQLRKIAAVWEAEDMPEAKLLAHLSRMQQIDASAETVTLLVTTLLAEMQDAKAARELDDGQ